MSTLSIPQVRQWRPAALETAATAVGAASTAVDDQARSLSSALEGALTDAGGRWADAARDRAADEARIGAQLADALDTARQVLSRGAGDIGRARTLLLDTISAAQADGFQIGDDGTVTAPTLPPVLTSPDHAEAAVAARNADQQRLNDRAQGIADDIAHALEAVADADRTAARGLGDVEFPQTLESAVDAYLDRAWQTRDLLGALGAAGAGAVSLAALLKKSVGLFGRSKSFLDFLKSSTAPITDYETFLRNINASDDALKAFVNGKADGGLARFLIGARAAKLAGKVFLPLTVATGAMDAVTGGGYDGARGWATRGFGLAGAAGGGALLASSAGLIALGPVGVGIAGAAVLGYGAWTLGNYVYDHWDDITEFGGKALDWTGDRLDDVADAADAATDWAGDRLADAGNALEDAGKSAVHTVTLGLL
ncbi:hypothetical protein GON03_10210 [Nocardioides sp. MAH-18]|uniref:Uncharacterized protein n=1 Tax=Nocardioides agri TaxID=2682843 RepID=A0A6L6XS04_9ACTN|nr:MULTISPECIES: hypothetical protein [unclassified Nocardioides]MBA2954697.1 hypothetical protein [Nocardioides sp. CGMCC 1.13656]MVQ49553.1 hypothetical protein [Nocardioides sp. MAH-18]